MVCSGEKLTKSHLCVAQLSQIFYAFALIGDVITPVTFLSLKSSILLGKMYSCIH